MTISAWRAQKNQQALMRLRRSLPETFPASVLAHAFDRPFTPATPRLAVDGYWRAHPLRADRLARALAARSDAPRAGPGAWAAIAAMGCRRASKSARALPRGSFLPRSGLLLRMRAAGLPFRLAHRPLAARTQQQRRMAYGLRRGVASVECPERLCPAAQTAAVASLRHHRNAALENRRSRSSGTAVPGLARAPARFLAVAARVLGISQSAGDQSRRSCGQMRRRGEVSRTQPRPRTR